MCLGLVNTIKKISKQLPSQTKIGPNTSRTQAWLVAAT